MAHGESHSKGNLFFQFRLADTVGFPSLENFDEQESKSIEELEDVFSSKLADLPKETTINLLAFFFFLGKKKRD